jgi:hypothetical protein
MRAIASARLETVAVVTSPLEKGLCYFRGGRLLVTCVPFVVRGSGLVPSYQDRFRASIVALRGFATDTYRSRGWIR